MRALRGVGVVGALPLACGASAALSNKAAGSGEEGSKEAPGGRGRRGTWPSRRRRLTMMGWAESGCRRGCVELAWRDQENKIDMKRGVGEGHGWMAEKEDGGCTHCDTIPLRTPCSDPCVDEPGAGAKTLALGALCARGEEEAGGHGVVDAAVVALAQDVRAQDDGAGDEEQQEERGEERDAGGRGQCDATGGERARTGRDCWTRSRGSGAVAGRWGRWRP